MIFTGISDLKTEVRLKILKLKDTQIMLKCQTLYIHMHTIVSFSQSADSRLKKVTLCILLFHLATVLIPACKK